MPTLPTLGITEKLKLLYCQNSITISEQDYSVANDTQEYFLLTKIYLIWCSLFRVVTASKRSLLRLRFYTCLSVILFIGGRSASGEVSIGGVSIQEVCIGEGAHELTTPIGYYGRRSTSGQYACHWIAILFAKYFFGALPPRQRTSWISPFDIISSDSEH